MLCVLHVCTDSLWFKLHPPVESVIRLLNTFLFSLFGLKRLSDSHDSRLLNKLSEGRLLFYPVRKTESSLPGHLLLFSSPWFALFMFTSIFPLPRLTPLISPPLFTPYQADLLPGGLPVFRGSLQQGGDSGCKRHHICRAPQREHSGTEASCYVRLINTQGLVCFALLSNQACWLRTLFISWDWELVRTTNVLSC